MSDYIRREALKTKIRAAFPSLEDRCRINEIVNSMPAADVVAVQSVIDRMNEERKRAKGNWHTDTYWLGWVDAMRRAQRIVDGTIDDEPVYAPSNEEKRSNNNE